MRRQSKKLQIQGAQVLRNERPFKNVHLCSRSRRARILTTGILRVFRGLKPEPDTEIGQREAFFKGLE
jgi:hypothetical protein